jgi:hypothetical protein
MCETHRNFEIFVIDGVGEGNRNCIFVDDKTIKKRLQPSNMNFHVLKDEEFP